MTEDEIVKELMKIKDGLKGARIRAARMAESTQNPSQEALDANHDSITEAVHNVFHLIQAIHFSRE